MTRQPRVAIYARVSTDEQSADAQLRDLREFATNRGWTDTEEFVDEGFSGSKDSRPAWNKLWDSIQKGRIKTLVVHALDRLGRSLPHLGQNHHDMRREERDSGLLQGKPGSVHSSGSFDRRDLLRTG